MFDKKIIKEIFSAINKTNRVLLALHVSPDADSVGSNLALKYFLEDLGKKVTLTCGSKLPKNFCYLEGINATQHQDFTKLDLSVFDLFIAVDCEHLGMVDRSEIVFPSKLKVINIDHHFANKKFGTINLIEDNVSSVAELLFSLFKKWKVKIDSKTAKALFLGIFGDTGCFQYSNTTVKTLQAAQVLMEHGADLNETVLFQFRSYSLKTLKYWGKVLDNMRMDESGKFVWSKVSQEELKSLQIAPEEIDGAASLFCPVILGTEFGIILDENEGFVKGSLRSRQNFDVSQIAQEMGGGGHRRAAGFTVKMSLEEAEIKVLEIARKYTRK